ncbi:MAG: hypothetical protein FWC40_09535, partial [Proteobacteria bacterium]|nr:hypothetical protein [Pseudomonadota bacterium]
CDTRLPPSAGPQSPAPQRPAGDDVARAADCRPCSNAHRADCHPPLHAKPKLLDAVADFTYTASASFWGTVLIPDGLPRVQAVLERSVLRGRLPEIEDCYGC